MAKKTKLWILVSVIAVVLAAAVTAGAIFLPGLLGWNRSPADPYVKWYSLEETEYVITTADQLYDMAYLSSKYDFEDQTFTLGADIVINDGNASDWLETGPARLWYPINGFAGTFDGQGHTISGLYGVSYNDYMGLFSNTTRKATVRDLKVVNSLFKSSGEHGTGVISANGGGTFEYIYTDAIIVADNWNIGGIIGKIDANGDSAISNCWFDGQMLLKSDQGRVAGGMVGDIMMDNGVCTIQHCLNTGYYTSPAITNTTRGRLMDIGGLVGRASSGTTNITDCFSAGKFDVECTQGTGIIIGSAGKGTTNISHTYADTETYVNAVGYRYNKTVGDVYRYEPEYLNGYEAYKWTTLDFEENWAVDLDGTPILKYFAEEVPSLEGIEREIDTSWYTKIKTYTIKNYKQLLGLHVVSQWDSLSGKIINLGADIVINEGDASEWRENAPELTWKGIGSPNVMFAGTFDGCGHSVSGAYWKEAANGIGFFRALGQDSVVRNFKLLNSYFETNNVEVNNQTYSYIGSIAGFAKGATLDTVYSNAIVVNDGYYAGGLIGLMRSTGTSFITNSWFDGKVIMHTETGMRGGGIVGTVWNGVTLTVSHCLMTGEMTSESWAWGANEGLIVGFPNEKCTLTIEDTLSAGSLTVLDGKADGNGMVVGRISGAALSVTFDDVYAIKCENPGIKNAEGKEWLANWGLTGYRGLEPTFAGPAMVMDSKYLTGYAAYQYTTLDFENYWAVDPYGHPVLKSFVEDESTIPDVSGYSRLVDFSWMDPTSDYYYLSNRKQLLGFAFMAGGMTFKDKYINITNDITLNSGDASTWGETPPAIEWIPIGNASVMFQGTFNGGGHTISGIYLKEPANCIGFFGAVREGTVKNLRLTNSYIESNLCADSLAKGKYTNYNYMGAIAGYAFGATFDTIYTDAIVKNDGEMTGGIVGLANKTGTSLTINNCWFDGTIIQDFTIPKKDGSIGAAFAGGIIGLLRNSSATITHCLSTATFAPINLPDGTWGTVTGGIVGRFDSNDHTRNDTLTIKDTLGAPDFQMPLSTQGGNGSVISQVNPNTRLVLENVYGTGGWRPIATNRSNELSTGVRRDEKDPGTVGTAESVLLPRLTGANALMFSKLDFENYWVAVEGTTPELKSFSTGKKADPKDAYDDRIPDTSWYDDDKDVFVLKNTAQMLGFAELSKTKDFAGKTVKLGADIAFNYGSMSSSLLSGSTVAEGVDAWTPIGTKVTPFRGVFDGQGHTISGLAEAGSGQSGLFAYVDDAFIQNVTIDHSIFRGGSGGGKSAGLVANTSGDTTIRRVTIGSDVRLYLGTYQGGVVAYNSGKLVLDNVWSQGYFNPQWAANAYVGGIVAANANTNGVKLDMSNVLYTGTMVGTVSGTSFVGGLIGASMNNPVTTVTDSLSAGNIQVVHGGETGQMYAGSLIGSKSWTEANTVFVDVYATTECFPVCEVVDGALAPTGEYYDLIREDQTLDGAYQVKTDKLLGEKAKKNAPGLDYKKYWTTVKGKTPELRNASSGEKTPKPITTPNKTPVDMSWYNDEDKVFTLKDAADLNGFAMLSQSNTFEGKTVKLGKDIVLNEGDAADWAENAPDNKWIPIGNVSYRFKGTFDGNGKTISGLYLSDNSVDGGSAMFGCIDGATIKNFKITNSYIADSTEMTDGEVWGRVASVVGTAYSGTIDSVYSDANLSGAAMFNGGIVGLYRAPRASGTVQPSELTITNCWYNGTMDLGTNGRASGGILGGCVDGLSTNVDQTKLTLENCLFSGIINGSFNGAEPSIGGIWGRMLNTNATVTDCAVTGSLNVNTVKYTGRVYGYKNYGAKVAFTDVYAVEEASHVNYIDVAHNTANNTGVANIVTVARADILGDLAKEKMTGLDFKKYWSALKDNTPVLKLFADETPVEPVEIPDAPSLTPDTSWYNDTDLEFVITTPEQLLGLAELSRINTFAGKTIKLGADIIFNEGVASGNLMNNGNMVLGTQAWSPIGSNVMPFKGVFDGMGYKIAGLASNAGNAALFAYVEDAFVQNVTIERSTFRAGSGGKAAGLIANAGGNTTVKRVYVTGSVNLYLAGYSGGIIGQTYGTGTITVDNVWADHYVNPQWASNAYVGGIVGANSNTELKLNISNALYTGRMAGTVAGTSFVGGLIGASLNNPVTTITDSLAAGNILVLHGGATGQIYAGSLIGSKSWTETNTVMTDVYVTENCFPVPEVVDGNVAATEENYGPVREDQSFASGVTVVETEDILGELAKKNAPGLDYKNVWMTVEEKVPHLRNAAAGEPTPKPITEVENTEVDISWYDASKSEFVLMDAADLNGFALLSQNNTFEGVTVKLGADIILNTAEDMASEDGAPANSWTPIGSVTYRFKGTFDGQGHTISGLYTVDSGAEGGEAMFACIDGATIKNFKLENSYIANSAVMTAGDVWGRVGSIVGTAYSGTIDNVYSDANLSGRAMFNGGIVGLYRAPRANGTVQPSELTITNCWYNGTIDLGDTGRSAGGILGGCVDGLAANVDQTKLTLENCLFSGVITGSFKGTEPSIGGLFGRMLNTNATITDCVVTGSLAVNAIDYVGSAYGYKNYGAKLNITDVYVTEETTYVAYKAIAHNTTNATGLANVVTVKRADILGDLAKDKLTGLDFEKTWSVLKDNTPVLKAFADETPAEPVEVPEIATLKPDTSWYDETKDEFVITTPEQLLGLAELSRINTFAGKTVKLGADIIFNEGIASANLLDSSGKPFLGIDAWTPIGSSVMPFRGVFDGMGYKIAGLASGSGQSALFAYVEDAFVQNVTIERSTFKGGSGGKSAALIANAGGNTTVKRVKVTGSVNLYLGTYNAAIIANTYGTGTITVDNVWSAAYTNPQWAGNAFVGGIIGSNSNTALTLNLSNALYTGRMAGTVAGESFVGGLIGATYNNPVTTVTDSLSAGNIQVIHGGATGKLYAGSLIGSKSWTDENTVMKDVYGTVECYPVCEVVGEELAPTGEYYGLIREDQTFTSGAYQVKTEDILGELAKTNASGLDYKNVWTTVEDKTPELRNPASGEPTPNPTTEADKTPVDVSWYDADESEFVLVDAADLNGFALLSQDNSFEGKTVKLGADIVLNNGDASTWATNAPENSWKPIGNVTYRFKGTFDGQGHTISGLYTVDSGADGGEAMFACIDGATIKNFKLENSYIANSAVMTAGDVWGRVGSIVGTAYSGTIDNVYSDADLSGRAMFNGGIVGLYRAPRASGAVQPSELTITNCWYNGTIDLGDTGRSAGGILGGCVDGLAANVDQTKLTIENCLFSGEISGSFNGTEPSIGGVFGRMLNTNATITDCLVSGALNVNTIKYTGSAYGYKNYGAKLNITDLYVVDEAAHVTYINAEHMTANVTGANNIVSVARADILGDLAKTNASGLDFENAWSVLSTNTPVLKAFADKTPMEPVEIPPVPALTPDTSWYSDSGDVFVITTPEQMLGFAELSQSKDFAGQTVKLGADIIFNEGVSTLLNGGQIVFGVQSWTPIGTKITPFRGVFDGMGYKIAGLANVGTGQSALFAYVEDAFVQNVTIERSMFRGGSSGGRTSALIANAGGDTTVKRIKIERSVSLYLGTYIGGVIANTYGTGTITVDNVWVNSYTNPQWTSGACVGGIVGSNSNTALKLNISNALYTGAMNGTVAGESFVGGLVGASFNTPVTTITDSLSAGNMTVIHGGTTGKMYAGSLLGSKSWTDANTVMTDVYGTVECFPVCAVVDGNIAATEEYYGLLRDDQTFASGVYQVKTADILGELAKTNASGLDYVNVWTTVEEKTPELRNPASGEPTPEPITEPDNTPVDTSWYDDAETEYVLMDAADLNGFARLALTNTFEGKTVKLGANITLNSGDASTWATTAPEYSWTAIGNVNSRFKGIFDGQGYTISGLYVSGSDTSVALFGCVDGGTVKNFKLVNSYIKSTESTNGTLAWSNMASIVSVTYGGTVSDIYTDAYVSGGSMNNGGIVGLFRAPSKTAEASLTISNCWFDGELDLGATGRSSGGIIGGVTDGANTVTTLTIENCLMTGTINSSFVGEVDSNVNSWKLASVGGLIGNFINVKVNVSDVMIAGEMNVADGATYVGSIYGFKNYGVATGSTADIYVTEEMHSQYYQSAGHNATTWEITKVKEEKLLGGLARLYAPGLDFSATGKWIAVKDAMPELRDFSTGTEADVMDEDPDAPKTIIPDTSWYDVTKTEFVIDTIEELFGFVNLSKTNTFEGKTVKLGANLTLNALAEGEKVSDWATTAPTYSWTPIGDQDNGFKGTFDGQGYSISGLYCVDTNYSGFVARLYGPGAVKNVKILNSYFSSNGTDKNYSGAGIVARLQNATVSGVYTDAILVSKTCAGIVASVPSGTSAISNCWFNGTINANVANGTKEVKAGGIAGYLGGAKTHTIDNCLFTGTITGPGVASYGFYGGLIGLGANEAGTTINVTNSLVAGDMTGITAGYVGAVTGHNPNSGSTNCTNVYATAETCTNLKGSGGGTFTGGTQVAKADILGGLARWNLSGLDFTSTGAWIAVEGKVPELRMFSTASEAPEVENPNQGGTDPDPVDPNAADTSWYNTTDTEFVLNTVGELKGFVSLVNGGNNFSGKTVKLGADIAWNTLAEGESAADWATTAPANEWTPIGSDTNRFKGTFDGNGKTISGLYYNKNVGQAVLGMFSVVEGATIKNLTVADSAMLSGAGSGSNGILVGTAYGVTVENVKIDSTVTVTGSTHTGTVAYAAGTNAVSFSNVWMAGTVTNGMYTARIGGLLGFMDNTTGLSISLNNCLFTGAVSQTHATTTAENYVGGFVGATPSNVVITVTDSLSAGTVTKAAGDKTYAGSVVGITSWRGATHTTFTDVYATSECNAKGTYRESTAYTGTISIVAKAEILGDLAKTNASGLDYESTWIAVPGKTPELKTFSTYDPTAEDTSWYNTTDTEFVLDTVGELKGFVSLVNGGNDFSGKTVKLGADIAWNTLAEGESAAGWATTAPANEWTPIGSDTNRFKGTFDGNGKTISGLYYNKNVGQAVLGMFSVVEGATIKNLTVADSALLSGAGSGSNGILVGTAYGVTVENVKIDSTVTVTGSTHTGTVAYAAGTNAVSFSNVWMAGTVTNGMYTARIGGLLGFTENTTGLSISLNNCLFTGTVSQTHATTTAENYVGGFVGATPSNVVITVTDSLSAGTVTKAAGDKTYAGSVVGITSWRGATHTTFTDVYATSECYSVGTYRAETAYTGTISIVAKANLLGDLAKTNASGLDYESTWITVTNSTPELRSFSAAQDPETPAEVNGIEVTAPTKTEYYLGETLVLDGMVVKTTYTDTTTKVITEGYTVSAFDSTTAGEKTITVTYGTFTDTFTVTVIDPAVETTAWYDDAPAGTTEYTLKTLGEFKGFVTLSQNNDFAGKTVKLDTDIVWNELGENEKVSDWATTAPANSWSGIANTATAFAGTFDGQNHTVSGLYAKNTTNTYAAFVGRLAGGTVKNVKIVNSYLESVISGTFAPANTHFHNVAAIVGRVTGTGSTVEGIYTDAILVGGRMTGLVGNHDAGTTIFIKNSWFNGTMKLDSANVQYAAGILAYDGVNNQDATIENCLFTGTMTGGKSSAYVGGLLGFGNWNAIPKVTNCLAAGDMTAVTEGVVGAIVGQNPGGNKGVYTNVYATNETHTNLKGGGGATYAPTGVAKADILGSLATSKLTGFDFTDTWTTVDNYVPVLKAFKAFAPVDPTAETTAWYGDGTATEFTISTVGELKGLVTLSKTNTFKGKTIKLGADIVWNELGEDEKVSDWATTAPANTWTPIGSNASRFAGTIDGDGHTISGLYSKDYTSEDGYNYIALVHSTANATIKNLRITDTYFAHSTSAWAKHTGVLVGCAYGVTIENVYTDAVLEGGCFIGMVAMGRSANAISISKTWFDGTITLSSVAGNNQVHAGGLFGANANGTADTHTLAFTDCLFTGTIQGASNASEATNVGGIAGHISGKLSKVTLTNCLSAGSITATGATGPAIGAVTGNCLWKQPAKTFRYNVYWTTETYSQPIVSSRITTSGQFGGDGDFTVAEGLTKADILGDKANSKLTGFDFTNTWTTVEDFVPVLKAFKAFAPEAEAKVNGIEVTAPTKTQYYLGETLVLDGMVVKTTYTDSSSKTITEGYTVSAFDSTTAGEKTITVTYGTFTDTFTVTVIDPNALDTSWYNDTDTTFTLTTAGQLKGLSQLAETNNFKGKTIKLGADIVLNELAAGEKVTDWATTAPANVWNPIGKEDATLAFEGTFDGDGHVISGLYYSSASYGGALFTYTGENAVIKNVTLDNSYIKSTHGAEWSATGGIAAFVNGTDFINVTSKVIIDADSGYVGGIAGRLQGNAATFENCSFGGTITGTGDKANYIGGLVGGFNTNTVGASSFTNCTVSGTVSGANMYVGGVTGIAQGAASSSVTIKNTQVSGAVTGTVGITGGFIGRVGSTDVTIEDSTFSGTVNGGTKLGGFVGQTNTAGKTTTVKNSNFTGTVTATNAGESAVAGFVGHQATGTVTVTDCSAAGTLVAPGPYAAGILACVENVTTAIVNLDGCIVTTDVQCASSNAGGIIGRLKGTNIDATVKNCLAKATFTTDTWCTSQIIAHAQGNATKMENNFFVQTTNSAATGIESSGSNVTNAPVKVTEAVWNYLKSCYEMGIKPDYDGFEDSGFAIADAADLYGFNVYNQVNGFSGKTAKLTADITINTLETGKTVADWATTAPKYNWAPVGNIGTAGSFAGTFDGQGYTISGLYCAHAGGNGMGMFREVTGTVKNFKLTNSYLANKVETNYGYNGTIAAYLNGGTISQVYTDAIIETIDSYAGGLVGFTGGTTATISECQFDGVLNARCVLTGACGLTSGQSRAHANHVGGIIGAVTATNNNVSDCIYSGLIKNECGAAHRTGGIVGGAPVAGKSTTITRCFSIGEFRADANSYHFSMIMDLRQGEINTTLTNAATVFTDNYVLAQQLYTMDGSTTLNSGSNLTGCNSNAVDGAKPVGSTVRYTEAEMIAKIAADKEAGTSNLDFEKVWTYTEGALPTLTALAD